MLINEWEIVLRLSIATVLGAMVGLERERQNQPAGLRTHIILVVGACMAMIISVNVAYQFKLLGYPGDPARIAAQVVSGIGFLGAGAILRLGNNVRGLTTATSLWTLAIIGLTVGAGLYIAAIAVTAILFISLTLLDRFEKRYLRVFTTMPVVITISYRAGVLKEVYALLKEHCLDVIQTSMARNLQSDEVEISLMIKTLENAPVDTLIGSLTELEGLRSFKVN